MGGGQWHPDPSGRWHLRWWDGQRWTEHIRHHGVAGTDPVRPAAGPGTQHPGPGAERPAVPPATATGTGAADPWAATTAVPTVGDGPDPWAEERARIGGTERRRLGRGPMWAAVGVVLVLLVIAGLLAPDEEREISADASTTTAPSTSSAPTTTAPETTTSTTSTTASTLPPTTAPPTTAPPTTAPPTTAPPPPTTAAPARPAAPAPPAGKCHPGYSGCVPVASDVDCRGGGGNGPEYVTGPVQILGDDPYELDNDNDGVGCEG